MMSTNITDVSENTVVIYLKIKISVLVAPFHNKMKELR